MRLLTLFFHEVCQVCCLLEDFQSNENHGFCGWIMANAMKEKFDKYWGETGRKNLLMYVAVIWDPRYKCEYIEFALDYMYKKDGLGKNLAKEAKKGLSDLYEEYKERLLPKDVPTIEASSVKNEGLSGGLSIGI